jgi:hypothetical protein
MNANIQSIGPAFLGERIIELYQETVIRMTYQFQAGMITNTCAGSKR